MPLLDSFKVDHTHMHALTVYVAKTMTTPKDDTITVFDLRFCISNKEILPERGIHTLKYLFADFMRDHLNGNDAEIIGISPTGCRAGFYMSLIDTPDEQKVADAWLTSTQDALAVQDQGKIPELNEYQCGIYLMHSLVEVQEITQDVLTCKVTVNKNEELSLDESLLNV